MEPMINTCAVDKAAPMGECGICGKPFQRKTGVCRNQKYCSESCKRKAQGIRKGYYADHAMINCFICGKPFIQPNSRVKCCSYPCTKAKNKLHSNEWHERIRASRETTRTAYYWTIKPNGIKPTIKRDDGTIATIARHEIRQGALTLSAYKPGIEAGRLINLAAVKPLATIHTVYSDGTERRWFDKIQKEV